MSVSAQIRIRRDTAANFTSANPTLALGEIAFETDTRNFKVGDGTTAWTSLPYATNYRGNAAAPTSNTVVGNGAGAALQSGGLNNAFIGNLCGDGVTTGDNNVAIGSQALTSPSASATRDCVAIGFSSAQNTTGDFNVAIGSAALQTNTGGTENVAIGYYAGQRATGNSNVAIGSQALLLGEAVSNNVAVGKDACRFGTAANSQIGVGAFALFRSLTSDNVAVGATALQNNTLGAANVAVGRSVLNVATTSVGTFTTTPVAGGTGYTANQTAVTVTLVKKSGADTFTGTVQASLTTNASGVVTAVAATPVSGGSAFTGSNVIFEPSGFGAGSGCEISIATLATGSSNTAIGHQAGLLQTTGSSNTLVGANAGDAITTGASNTAVGFDALGGLTTGTNVVAIGSTAARGGASSSNSVVLGSNAQQTGVITSGVCIGTSASISNTTATQSIVIGASAGRYIGASPSTTNLTAFTSSIFIGHQARAAGDSQTNQVVIAGVDGVGNGSNTTTLGNSSTTGTFIPGGNLTLSNGNLILGTSGKGIDFSATTNSSGTMTSELLDDYEEGTWTPTVGGFTSPTYASQEGWYVKIGKMVYFQLLIDLSGGTAAASQLFFGGLPFNSASTTALGVSGAYWAYTAAHGAGPNALPTLYIAHNSSTVQCFDTNGNPYNADELTAPLTPMRITGMYRTA
jgi:hypothetical protein